MLISQMLPPNFSLSQVEFRNKTLLLYTKVSLSKVTLEKQALSLNYILKSRKKVCSPNGYSCKN